MRKFFQGSSRGIGISHRQQRNQKFLTRVYLNRNGNATFHLRPSCWTLFHIWFQRKKPTVFGVCSAGTTCDSSLAGKTLKLLKTVSSPQWTMRIENGRMLFLLLFFRLGHVGRLGNLAKTAFFCVGSTHSLLQYRDLAVIAAALLPVHFGDFMLATIA